MMFATAADQQLCCFIARGAATLVRPTWASWEVRYMSEVVSSDAGRVAEAPYPAPAVGWYATIMLAFLYWLSVLDRFIISLLVDPIKHDLGLTDVQFGMLHGLAFVGAFTLFGLVFGAFADSVNRRKLIYVGVTIWSIGTAFCGVAQNFWHLLLARVGVGVGEASMNPCASSMIADLFPREKLTTAMAVYAIGATVGSGTALLIGGMIVDVVSHMDTIVIPLIGEIRPWQAVFFIIGIPGSLLALIIFTVPEPVRRGQHSKPVGAGFGSTYVALFKFMRARPRFFVFHYLGFMLAAAVTTGGVAWYPVHISRSFGWSAGQIGAALGPALMIAGIVSKLATGQFVDAMYRRGYRDAQMRWYGICMLLAAPIGVFATMSSTAWTFVIAIGVFMTFIGAFQACSFTALNLVTPNELRGTGIAVFTTFSGLVGGGAGPVLIAKAAELGGHASIGVGLAMMIGIMCPLGAVLLLSGLGAMRAAMAETEGSATVARQT
jgi:MFS family permease